MAGESNIHNQLAIYQSGELVQIIVLNTDHVALTTALAVELPQAYHIHYDDDTGQHYLEADDDDDEHDVLVNDVAVTLPYALQIDDEIVLDESLTVRYVMAQPQSNPPPADAAGISSETVEDDAAPLASTDVADEATDTPETDADVAGISSETVEDDAAPLVSTDVADEATDTPETDADAVIEAEYYELDVDSPSATPQAETIEITTTDDWALVPAGERRLADRQLLNRLGCGFCFRTLDPNDDNPKLRTFVQYNQRHYHDYCWSHHKPKGAGDAQALTIIPPDPLAEVHRTPVLFQGGPVNAITDQPLGISTGTISFDHRTDTGEKTLLIRNNTNTEQLLSRRRAPLWVYIDYGNYRAVSDEMSLHPNQEQTVTLHVHPAQPIWTQSTFYLNDQQALMIVSNRFKLMFALSILVLLVLTGSHLFFSWDWIWQEFDRSLRDWVLLSLTTGGFIAWLFFMMPAQALWFIFDILQAISQIKVLYRVDLIKTAVDGGQNLIWEQFARERVVTWLQQPLRLLGMSVVVALLASMLALPLWALFGSISFTFSFLVFIATLAYLLFVYVIVTSLLQTYGIEFAGQLSRFIRLSSRRVIRAGRDALR
jgi:hypothetical protein